MCGIVGITSTKPVTSMIVNSLRKLEYRGYDSSGIATLHNGNINEVKCEGRVDALEKNLNKSNLFLIHILKKYLLLNVHCTAITLRSLVELIA